MTNDLSKNTTELEIFKPSANQEKWLDMAMQTESGEISEIASKCRIDRTTYYEWRKNPDFRDWYLTEWNNRLSLLAPQLDAIGIKQSKKDFNYWKAMQQKLGYLQEKPIVEQNFTVKWQGDNNSTDPRLVQNAEVTTIDFSKEEENYEKLNDEKPTTGLTEIPDEAIEDAILEEEIHS